MSGQSPPDTPLFGWEGRATSDPTLLQKEMAFGKIQGGGLGIEAYLQGVSWDAWVLLFSFTAHESAAHYRLSPLGLHTLLQYHLPLILLLFSTAFSFCCLCLPHASQAGYSQDKHLRWTLSLDNRKSLPGLTTLHSAHFLGLNR